MITSRYLGPEKQGTLAALVAWITIFFQFFSLSIGQIIQHRFQQGQRDDKQFLSLLSANFVALTVLLCVTACISFTGSYLIFGETAFKGLYLSIIVMGAGLIACLMLEEHFRCLFIIYQKVRLFNLYAVIGRTVWLLSTLFVVFILNKGIEYILIAQSLGALLVMLLCCNNIKVSIFRFELLAVREMIELCRNGLNLHLNTIATYVLAQCGILVLNLYAEKPEVAWFQIAFQMVMILTILPQSLSTALYAKMADTGIHELWPHQKRLILPTLGLMLVLCLLAYYIAPYFILLVLGEAYQASIPIFQQLLPMLFGITIAQIMAPQWIGRGLFLLTSSITAFTAVGSIIAHFLLIPVYGIQGAVWVTAVGFGLFPLVVQLTFALWCQRQYQRGN